jgi:two-component system, NtrC family, nitrogen regulation response regulator NtrX
MKTHRPAKILIVDDEKPIRDALRMVLEYEGFKILEAADADEAKTVLDDHVDVDVALVDVMLPGRDGLAVLSEIRKRPSAPEVIMISGHATVQTAVEATKRGAFEFLEKPLSTDRVLLTIRNALNQNILQRECIDLRRKAEKRHELIGEHPLMKQLWKEILKTAPTNATVLIHGESGTGKELIARAIHDKSLRSKEPFVQVNCAAIPEELIESELFGHEKGSFTGATERKIGKFDQADGGTIFLDEIGDMSLRTQSKVLRVLEEGEIQRVGSSKINEVDVRVIAATNKDLKNEIAENRFRDDLYFRLNVVPIHSPALREKREDIPVLIDFFSRNYAEENNFRSKRFAPDALEAMLNYSWKGNVRELRNVVERLMIMAEGEIITRKDLPEPVRGEPGISVPDPATIKTLKDFRDLAEKDFIVAKLQKNNWNISQTAREIDTPRSNLYKKLAQYGIKITVGLSDSGGEAPAAEKSEPGSD